MSACFCFTQTWAARGITLFCLTTRETDTVVGGTEEVQKNGSTCGQRQHGPLSCPLLPLCGDYQDIQFC